MALVVNTNMAALNSQRNLGINNSALSKSLERLSSGLRINKAADDAAGLAIATKFDAQVKGLTQAVRNSNNAVSLVQTAEGGINNLTNILQRLRELAVQSSSDDNTPADRQTLTSEASNLIAEFTRISSTTEFNTMSLLDGTFQNRYFQVGANYAQLVTFSIGDARGKSIGGRAEFDADIADGLTNASNGNFGGSEFKINDVGVQATNSTDDQYSVMDLTSGQVSNITVSLALSALQAQTGTATFSMASASNITVTMNFTINSVAIALSYKLAAASISAVSFTDVTGTSFANVIVAGSTIATDLASAIANNASLAALNITARTVNGSGWVVERTGGGNVTALMSLNIQTSLVVAGSYSTQTIGSTYISIIGANGLMSGVTSVIGDGRVLTAATAPTAYNGESSAIAKAVAINAVKSTSGVTATARANVVTAGSSVQAGTISSGDLYINGVNIGGVTTILNDGNGALVTAINAVNSQTGVVATTDANGKLLLTAADGRNITVTAATSTVGQTYLGFASDYFTNTTAVFRSTVRLNSGSEISLSGTLGDLYDAGTTDPNNVTKTTDATKTAAVDLSTYNVSKLQIDTQGNAQSAILTIDAALDNINLLRSQIGAIQNRLEFTVANLQVASENMSASESRIKDADFAAETTSFTRNQILVQAGTAMLAQANTLQQVALQLLKG